MWDTLILALALLFLLGFGMNAWEALEERRQERRGPGPSRVPPVAPAEDDHVRLVRDDAQLLRLELGDYPDPDFLAGSDLFAEAVERLASHGLRTAELTRLAAHGDRWISRIALGVLAGRTDIPDDWPSLAIPRLRQAPYDQARLFLLTLRQARRPVLGAVLAELEHVRPRDAAELVAARRDSGRETLDVETLGEHVPLSGVAQVEAMLDEGGDLVPELRQVVEEWRAETVDLDFLRMFADVWKRPYDTPPALLTRGRAEIVELIHESLSAAQPQSLLLVGEHGVGKTALVRAAVERLPEGWLVFEASASSVNAGAMFIGELEGRVAQIVEALRGRQAVWVLPNLEEALFAGQHMQSPTGLLDLLLPHLQAGTFRVVAETSPAGLELVRAQRPQVSSALRAVRVRPPAEGDAIAVARHALQAAAPEMGIRDEVLAESFELAQQFLVGVAPPGNVVRLLRTTADSVAEQGRSELETADVLTTLAAVSGLPLALLDPAASLDLAEVREFFEARVLGQAEAVDCVVERIALVKAGLTDPTRPLGVFLFVGPTGTGKTEIAKALAEFLFGSPGRMVRLDMSEFQTPESLERLLSDTNLEPQGAPLVASVRKEPFSVVLLDEFEKAAPPLWDVFLQVFDDGRLTDRHGRTVDFRKCVIVLTANVGSAIARGPGLGFTLSAEPFRPQTVERAVAAAFRPEFLNRLDRVVVFRPFERAQMRALLEKELAEAAARRGFRGRPWAVEYDETALALLIDRGFSPELGARPLKRAVERYLLAPLARAIVDGAVPEGEQFLLVTATKGELEVRFVDPDAEDEQEETETETARRKGAAARELDLRSLTLAPRADAGAVSFLLDELRRIESAAAGEAVRGRKEEALRALGEPGFWEDEGRFGVLAEAEYLDRFEAALRTAGKLGERLRRGHGRNGHGSSRLASLLAARLYVLDRALEGLAEGAPRDVFLRLRPAAESDGEAAAEFADSLAGMYAGWAARRGMRLEHLPPGTEGVHVLAVGGLGSATILAPEAGLHVLELPGEEAPARTERVAVAVEVAPWLPAEDGAALEARAEAALAAATLPAHVVRRYRGGSSPLVRDAIRSYRTGRLDRVLAGDFDVF